MRIRRKRKRHKKLDRLGIWLDNTLGPAGKLEEGQHMKHLAQEGTRSYECWGVDDPFPCRDCLKKTYTMKTHIAQEGARGFECGGPGTPFCCRDCYILQGTPMTQTTIPTSPEKRYPLGVVIMWAIAALSIGFAFAGLLLACTGTTTPTNYCCYGGKTPSCVDAFPGCTFHATEFDDAGDGECGTMTCDGGN
jgi:hypothetical protein